MHMTSPVIVERMRKGGMEVGSEGGKKEGSKGGKGKVGGLRKVCP